MSDESLEPNAEARTTARRRLVRGVFVAPAALTLYSGGAIAATSVSCVARQQDPTRTVNLDTSGWVRVPVWKITAADNKGSLWVRGLDLAALHATSSYLASGSWQLISREANSSFSPIGYVSTSTPSQPLTLGGSATPTQTTTYVAVRINSAGGIVGVEPIDTSSQASVLSTSCWTSFGGVANW